MVTALHGQQRSGWGQRQTRRPEVIHGGNSDIAGPLFPVVVELSRRCSPEYFFFSCCPGICVSEGREDGTGRVIS